jgi:hypothetical protein
MDSDSTPLASKASHSKAATQKPLFKRCGFSGACWCSTGDEEIQFRIDLPPPGLVASASSAVSVSVGGLGIPRTAPPSFSVVRAGADGMGWPFDVHCTDTSVARVTVRRHRVEVHTRAARERSRQPRDVMHLASLATRTVGGTFSAYEHVDNGRVVVVVVTRSRREGWRLGHALTEAAGGCTVSRKEDGCAADAVASGHPAASVACTSVRHRRQGQGFGMSTSPARGPPAGGLL